MSPTHNETPTACMRFAPSLPALLIALVTCLGAGAAVVDAWASGASSLLISLDEPAEVPDDPPGIPVRPLPGAPPASPVEFEGSTSIQVNVAAAGANIFGDAANEPSLAVNPLFPNNLAIGWRQFDTVTSNFRQAGWAHSSDGGRSWTFPGVLDPGVFRSDPVLDFDAAGVFHYSSLTGDLRVDLFTSFDNGVSWSSPVPAFGGDKQWIAVDRTGGIGAGNIYQIWSPFGGCCGSNTFTRSTDSGQSFQTPVMPTGNPRRGTLDVGPDGTVYAAGVHPNDTSTFYVVRSPDAQDPTATPTFELVTVDMGGSLVRPLDNFGFPNPNGLNGQVWVDTDHSGGPTHGYVYVLCSVDPPGVDPLDVHLIRSTDGGVTWSTPVRINDDPPASGAWQWFGTMSVAPNGRIDVVWNDTREPFIQNFSALYYSCSTDGGLTWTDNRRLSPFWDSHIGFPNQNKIGDYYHMVSDAVGAHLAWAATFNGEQDVYYLRIGDYDCNVNGVPDSTDIANGTSPDTNMNGIPDECETTTAVAGGAPTSTPRSALRLHQNAPNPFNPSTTIRFDASAGGQRARIRIFDARGRLVRTLHDGEVAAGTHTLVWDGRDQRGEEAASGIYYYRLEAAGFGATRAMVLLR